MIAPALLALALAHSPPATTDPPDVALAALAPGVLTHGFVARAVYLDGNDKPLGARFVHKQTGFTFDYLRIESAPQGFLWVNSFPTSDKGEPHTQEHLLLGKGDRGRRLGSFEAMALAESSAFTAQWRTAYHFHTVAGHDVFWPVFENQLDAMLNPDYTDEEIRREVRNFGVDKSDDGTLHLEEKGTVYNEMVRSYESPDAVLWREAGRLLYGSHHPLAYESGGFPDAIRTMTAADIRTFHDANYHLANMGMVAAFPASMPLASVLDHTGAILLKEGGRTGTVTTEANLPKPSPVALSAIAVVPFPDSDTTSPGPMLFAWPATRNLDETDHLLASLFLDAFAGDESTTLYKKLIDSKTRVLDIGASSLYVQLSQEQGQPLILALAGVKSDKLDAQTLAQVRTLIIDELKHIAALPDGDPELVALQQRIQSRMIDTRRQLNKFLDSPPGFGFRGTGTSWIDHLHMLNASSGFAKSLTLKPELQKVAAVVDDHQNPWRTRLARWGFLETPFGVAAKPSPQKRARLDAERKGRIDAELARLERAAGSSDAQSTLQAFQRTYDAETAAIEGGAKAAPLPPLVDSVPMSSDEGLAFQTAPVGGVPALTATFDSMASARVQLALRLDTVAADDLFVLGILPSLLTDVGVIVDGKPVSSEEVRERLRKEVLELGASTSENLRTGRVELVLSGAGNDAGETRKALDWMRRVLLAPDWRKENLPRLRDVVDQAITALGERMQGAEEGWVEDPRDAWWRQTSPLHLHTSAFLTEAHDLHRLRWMLADPDDKGVTDAVAASLDALAGAGKLSRSELVEIAATLAGEKVETPHAALASWQPKVAPSSPTAALLIRAGKDLSAALPALPDGSLRADWSALCAEMARDLRLGAPAALARLERVRRAIVAQGNARVVEVGASGHLQAIAADVAALVGSLDKRTPARVTLPAVRAIALRMKDHDPKATAPVFVGLVAPATSSGVFLNTAPASDVFAKTDDALLDYLAAGMYAGHGAHSLFMKTWAAGLAYSNGVHPQLWSGRLEYYAERCPLLPQTLRFVVDELKRARPDTNIARYTVAGAFRSRSAEPYEQRASAMAENLVDGETPEVVKAFRARLLAMAKRPDIADVLSARMLKVYGAVMPGLGKTVDGGVYFVIGPEAQLAPYQDYLHAAVGKDATLFRLYPRDFWVP